MSEQVASIKSTDMKDFLISLDTPDKLNRFIDKQPEVTDVEAFLSTVSPKDMGTSKMFSRYDKLLPSEQNSLIWAETIRRTHKDLHTEFTDNLNHADNTLALIASMLGGTSSDLIKPAENVNTVLMEQCIRMYALLQLVISKVAFTIQNRIGFDQLYLPDPDGTIYAPNDIRTTVMAVAKGIL